MINQSDDDSGAAMLRTKGEAGTGNIVEAVRHARAVQRDIRRLTSMDKDELFIAAKVGLKLLIMMMMMMDNIGDQRYVVIWRSSCYHGYHLYYEYDLYLINRTCVLHMSW